MPAILEPESYKRWLGLESDPYDLLITYPSEPMTMWPISTRVNKPENDDPSILDQTVRTRLTSQHAILVCLGMRRHSPFVLLPLF